MSLAFLGSFGRYKDKELTCTSRPSGDHSKRCLLPRGTVAGPASRRCSHSEEAACPELYSIPSSSHHPPLCSSSDPHSTVSPGYHSSARCVPGSLPGAPRRCRTSGSDHRLGTENGQVSNKRGDGYRNGIFQQPEEEEEATPHHRLQGGTDLTGGCPYLRGGEGRPWIQLRDICSLLRFGHASFTTRLSRGEITTDIGRRNNERRRQNLGRQGYHKGQISWKKQIKTHILFLNY